MNVVYNVCGIVTMPVEMVLRPHYGSRYFPPVIMFFQRRDDDLHPADFQLRRGGGHFFLCASGIRGPFGMWGLSKLFFLGALRARHPHMAALMIHMEREQNSQYEGPPLFIFNWLPGTFWRVRILYEPLFLFVLSIVLPNFFILQPSAANFLDFSAMVLAMKKYTAWYMQWQFLRGLMDMQFGADHRSHFRKQRNR